MWIFPCVFQKADYLTGILGWSGSLKCVHCVWKNCGRFKWESLPPQIMEFPREETLFFFSFLLFRLWWWFPISHWWKVCPRLRCGGRGLLPLHSPGLSMPFQAQLLPLLHVWVPLCWWFLWRLQWSPDETWACSAWPTDCCLWGL